MNAFAHQDAAECVRVLGIPIENQTALAAKEATVHIGDVARDLRNLVLRVGCNAGDVDGSGGDVDKEQDVLRDETCATWPEP